MSLRLFAGLELPTHVAANLAALLDKLRPAAALRWSPAGNLHITTKFIGAFPEPRLSELKRALTAVAAGAFDVETRGLGWFPNPHQPHTFFAGIHAGDALPALHAATDAATTALGISKETKPYSPHLTLGRVPSGGKSDLAPLRRAVASLDSVDFGVFRADRFFLYRSDTSQQGSIYTKLAEFPL